MTCAVPGQYQGETVVVTGASGGIGAEIARELARRGAHVLLVARGEERLAHLAGEIANDGGSATAIVCDVTDESAVKASVKQIKERFGRIRLLVNNAGRELLLPLQITRPQAARDLLELNLVAMAEMSRSCLGLLKGDSAIINMASAVAIRPAAGLSLYAASKAAVIGLTRALAKELAPRGIRVNAVAPGIVRTEMADRMFAKLKPDQIAELEAAHPLGFGSPADVARAVAFLGSHDARWITGHTLVVDGGFSA